LWFAETGHKKSVQEVENTGEVVSKQVHDDMWRWHEPEHHNVSEFEPVSISLSSDMLKFDFELYHFVTLIDQ